jgi:hypothetical protein
MMRRFTIGLIIILAMMVGVLLPGGLIIQFIIFIILADISGTAAAPMGAKSSGVRSSEHRRSAPGGQCSPLSWVRVTAMDWRKRTTIMSNRKMLQALPRLGPEKVLNGIELCPCCDSLSPGIAMDGKRLLTALCATTKG